MSGTKGHSGGHRKGAGRTPHSLRLRDGTEVFLTEQYDGQPVLNEDSVFTVQVLKRGCLRLTNDKTEYILTW